MEYVEKGTALDAARYWRERTIASLKDRIRAQNIEVGWVEFDESGNPLKRNFGEVIALIHSEVSEALEGRRQNLADKHLPHRRSEEVELADAIIRILDLAAQEDLDVENALIEKLEYNRTRADHKREARAAKNGKRF